MTITRAWSEAREEERAKVPYFATEANDAKAEKAAPMSFRDINPLERACMFLLGHGDYAGQFTAAQIAEQFGVRTASVTRIWREEEASQRAGAEWRVRGN